MIAQSNVNYRKGTDPVYDRVGYEQKDGYRIVIFNGKYGIQIRISMKQSLLNMIKSRSME